MLLKIRLLRNNNNNNNIIMSNECVRLLAHFVCILRVVHDACVNLQGRGS